MVRPFILLCVLFLVAANFGTAQSPPYTQCTVQVGASPSCAVLIVIQPNGSLKVLKDPSISPYDGNDDTLVGVLNNSGSTVYGISLTGPGIFGFDGDGLCQYITCSWPAMTGYEGPNTSFNAPSANQGIVNFFYPNTSGPGLPNGKSLWFSLEGAPSDVAHLSSSVALDPGHGQTNCPYSKALGGYLTGATGTINYPASNPPAGYLLEYKLTYAIALQLQAQLKASGYQVAVTRNSLNECPMLAERNKRALDAHANLFLSIHLDGLNTTSHGTSVYYNPANTNLSSATLAAFTATDLAASLGTSPNGPMAEKRDLVVLKIKNAQIAAVLAEVAFLDNIVDQNIMHNAAAIGLAATGLFNGINAFVNQPAP